MAKTLIINDQFFAWVCGDSTVGRAVYRGPGVYLRIGVPAVAEQEIALQRRLLAQGFPVAPLLHTGEYAGQPFFIETALGDTVFSEIFEREMRELGAVRAASFNQWLAVVCDWASAQLQNVPRDNPPADLARTVRLADVERLLPALKPLTQQAFALVQQRLQVFPSVLTHGDFHPGNVCAGGVIDLEMAHWSVAGYDVITGLLENDLFPPELTDYAYSADQLESACAAIDHLFQTYGLPPPSTYAADFRLCRMMRIVELAEKRPSAVQQWIQQRYVTLATAYVHQIKRLS